MPAPLFTLGVVLFMLGFLGLLVRRSFLASLAGALLALVGAGLVFGHYALLRGDPGGLARAVVLLLLGGALAGAGSAFAIAIYRRRGTVNLDELRELRG